MRRKAHTALEERRPLPDTTTDKLVGVHRKHPSSHPQSQEGSPPHAGTLQHPETPQVLAHGSEINTAWSLQSPIFQPRPELEDWRHYATPASTPKGDQSETWLQEDMIHVDIAPEEPSTEQSNWESFIHQLRADKSPQ